MTDGHSRTFKIEGRTVRFRHARPSVMKWASRSSSPVVQALRWLVSEGAIDGEPAEIYPVGRYSWRAELRLIGC